MTKATTRAALYCRISSEREGNRLGVKDQERRCRRFCQDQGWTVGPVFVDNDVSAADPKKARPEYEHLMQAVRRGEFDAVVVVALDRLYRQPIELEQFVLDCKAVGMGTVGMVTGGVADLSDPDAVMLLRIKGSMAAAEVDKIRIRCRAKKEALATDGQFSGGTRPFGYEKDGVTVRESEAALIRSAAARVLSGGSVYAIREDWRASGIPTVRGGRWETVTITKLLQSARLAGLRTYHGAIVLDADGSEKQAAWPAILDRDIWEQVRAILSDPSRRRPPARHQYPLRGVLRCAECGSMLVSLPAKDKTGVSRNNYGCRKESGGCGHVRVAGRAVEAYVFGIIRPLADSPTARDIIRMAEAGDTEAVRQIVQENATDERKLSELSDMLADGDLDRSAYVKQSKRLHDRIEARHSQLAGIQGQSALDRLGGHVAERWDEMSADDKRSIVTTFAPIIKVRPATRYGNTFDTRRLWWGWRYSALAKAAEGIEPTDEELEANRALDHEEAAAS